MNKQKLVSSSICVVAFLLTIAATRFQKTVLMLGTHSTKTSATVGNTAQTSAASWVSQAITVKQLTSEANLIVRARVSKAPVTRIVSIELPMVGENNVPTGSSKTDQLPFSDTLFNVLDTYYGKSSPTISVMQTGGAFPETPDVKLEMPDDPLYIVGDEYILFLVDISGDPVQAPGRQLYRIVNPSGRYRIDGSSVFSYGINLSSVRLPATVIELEAQIKQAVK